MAVVLISGWCLGCASTPHHAIPAPHVIAWGQDEPPDVVSAYRYTLAVDGGLHTPLEVACVASGRSSTCTAHVPLTSGRHRIVLAVVGPFGERQVVTETVDVN